MLTAKETLSQKGYAPELLDALNCSSNEAFTKSLNIIEKQFKIKQDPQAKTGFQFGSDGIGSKPTGTDPIKRAMGLN